MVQVFCSFGIGIQIKENNQSINQEYLMKDDYSRRSIIKGVREPFSRFQEWQKWQKLKKQEIL